MCGKCDSRTRWVTRLEEFFSSWRFPVLFLFLLLFATLLVGLLLLFPRGDGALAAFAEAFRRWCFGSDPAGEPRWEITAAVLFQPVLLGGIAIALWRRELRVILGRPRVVWPWAGAAFVLIVGLGAGVAALPKGPTEVAFPGEDLRTSHAAPAFSLISHDGSVLSLAELRGRPVIVTAVYGSCGLTCPMILRQAKRVVASLTPAERAELTVVAITLDPERDTREARFDLARLQGLSTPIFHFVGGDPPVVDAVLDGFGFARRRDPETGVIAHANLFILVDRRGRIAYRFTLGEPQERWLLEALRLLLAEAV